MIATTGALTWVLLLSTSDPTKSRLARCNAVIAYADGSAQCGTGSQGRSLTEEVGQENGDKSTGSPEAHATNRASKAKRTRRANDTRLARHSGIRVDNLWDREAGASQQSKLEYAVPGSCAFSSTLHHRMWYMQNRSRQQMDGWH